MYDMICGSGIGTGTLPCFDKFDKGSRKTQTWKTDDKHKLCSNPFKTNTCLAHQGYVLNTTNRSSNVPVVQEPCIEENGLKRRSQYAECDKNVNIYKYNLRNDCNFKILKKTECAKHTELKRLQSGLLGGKYNWNAGLKSGICRSAYTSNRQYRGKPECTHVQPQISITINEDPCSTLLNCMLFEHNNKRTTTEIDGSLSKNVLDFELDDAPNEYSKEDDSCSNSICPSDIRLLDTKTRLQCNLSPTQLSSLIKNEMKLKIQYRRVQEGLPEMPDMHDNARRNTIELSDEEKQRQQKRLNRARNASKNYRRKFKSRETQLKEAFKCELQQRTQLQQEINLLKQKKDDLNKSLQYHNCKHASKAGVVQIVPDTFEF